MFATLNQKLTGFRTILAWLMPFVAIYVDTFTANVTGISIAQLKVTAAITAPVAIKAMWTDVRPKIMGWFKST